MKKLSLFAMVISLLFLLTGCLGKLELEERDFVVVIGVDLAEDQDNLIDVTFQVANPQVGSSERGAAQNEPPSDIITIRASDIMAAKDLANSIIPRQLTFAHLRTVILSEEFAKTDIAHEVINSLIMDPEFRRENHLIVSKEKAKDFIHANKPKLETRPHKYYTFMQQRWRDTGVVAYSNFNRYLQRLKGEIFLAIYATAEKEDGHHPENEDEVVAGEIFQEAGDPVQMMGSAAFKYGKMIGTLTGEETRLILLMRPKSLLVTTVTSFPDPLEEDQRITVKFYKKGQSTVKVNTDVDPPHIKVHVPLIANLYSDRSLTNYTSNMDNQRVLVNSIEEKMKENAMKLIKKTQDEYKADPFLWNLPARRNFKTVREYEQYNWEKKFPHAKVDVTFEVFLEMLGTLRKPVELEKE